MEQRTGADAALLDALPDRAAFGLIAVVAGGRAPLVEVLEGQPVSPVSYTHLDVYKRQVYVWAVTRQEGHATEPVHQGEELPLLRL